MYLTLYLRCIQTWAGNIVSQCIRRRYALYFPSRGGTYVYAPFLDSFLSMLAASQMFPSGPFLASTYWE